MLILAITAFPSQLYAQKSGEPKRDAPKGKESSNQLVSQRVGTLNMDTLEYSLNLIKSDYETSLLSLKDPKMIQALSLKETDLALFMTVAVLDPTTYGNYYADRSGLLERLWANGKMSLEIKEIYTLVLYSEALSRLVVIIAGKEDNQEVLSEFVNVTKESAIGKAKSQPAKIAEARVYWSNRIVIMTSLLIKVLSPEKYQNLEDIMDDLLNRAEVIATRRDVHYQARMDLLYLNNVQSISSMLFLLAKDSGSAIGESAAAMEDRWEERIADSDFQVSEKTSLSLVSNAQLCFPLFHSIATGKYMKHGPQKF
ncbi:MAG: hypothetical protein LBE27_07240 [Deltaproteobacteria bacterium]|nr:hypothetical protein [Deltaproteobacteria bacterium]